MVPPPPLVYLYYMYACRHACVQVQGYIQTLTSSVCFSVVWVKRRRKTQARKARRSSGAMRLVCVFCVFVLRLDVRLWYTDLQSGAAAAKTSQSLSPQTNSSIPLTQTQTQTATPNVLAEQEVGHRLVPQHVREDGACGLEPLVRRRIARDDDQGRALRVHLRGCV